MIRRRPALAALLLGTAAWLGRAGAAETADFTWHIRALAQLDLADYMQSSAARLLPAANGPFLSSGANFRRAYLGVQGTVFGDWSYNLNFDFGGSGGTETGGHIQSAYVQYDGLAPFAARIGAYPPPAGLEDSTGPQDTLFLERAAPGDVMRNTAAGDGRDAATLFYADDRVFAALSWTGGKVGDGPVFGEQSALVGRVAAVPAAGDSGRLVMSASFTHVFRGAGSGTPPGVLHTLSLSAPPELTVDSGGIRLVSTGTLDIDSANEWALESGATWHAVFAQAGYFRYSVDRHGAPEADFGGWYAEASWTLTGESRGYNTATAAFTAPRPVHPLSRDGRNWGAFEIAVRYSDLDLNSAGGLSGLPVPAGGVRGGEQRIASAGLNWYPNAHLKFAVDYQYVDVARLGSLGQPVGQRFGTLAARAQLSF